MIGLTLAHFHIVAKLGEGGMGVVYRATDEKLRRDVALKVLPDSLAQDPDRRRRFLREARAAAAVSHGNIATVHEIGEADGHVFIAMELVEGETLRDRMAAGLTYDETLRIAKEIAKGLARAHDAGVVHRDLKPENVMITKDGEVKILDFGLAKLVDDHPERSPLALSATASHVTAEGRLMGTPPYMSPEQAEGRAAIDARSDVFSLGAMLYEMLSGTRPFDGTTGIDVLYAVLHKDPVALEVASPGVPAVASAVVARCLKKNPSERFASGRDVLAALEPERAPQSGERSSGRAPAVVRISTVSGMGTALGATIASDSAPLGPTEPSVKETRRRSITWALMGLGVLIVVVAGFALRPRGGKSETTAPPAPTPSAKDVTFSRSSILEAQRYFDEGMQSFREGTGQAVPLLLKAVEADPKFGGAYLRLWGLTAFGDRTNYVPHRHDAPEFYRHATALQATLTPGERALFNALDLEEDDPKRSTALRAYLADHPDDDFAWWATLFSDAESVEAVLAARPTLVPAIARQAEIKVLQGDFDGGMRVLDACLEASPHAVDCLHQRSIYLDRFGRCEAALKDVRQILALAPDAVVSGRLAGLLAARGASPAAIAEALGPPRPGHTGDGQVLFAALIPMFEGDFAEVAKLGNDALAHLSTAEGEGQHWEPTSTALYALIESGDSAGAAAVASEYLERRVAWPNPTPIWLGPVIGAAARGGRMDAAAARRRLEQEFQGSVTSGRTPSDAWAMTYANASETRAEGAAALAKFDDLHATMPVTWRGAAARAFFLGGRGEDARPLLTEIVRSCSATLLNTRNWVHAHLYLGEMDEKRGDTPSACTHFAKVLARWGHAKPRSVIADEARVHAKALKCDLSESTPPSP